jgi:hypothetical protein
MTPCESDSSHQDTDRPTVWRRLLVRADKSATLRRTGCECCKSGRGGQSASDYDGNADNARHSHKREAHSDNSKGSLLPIPGTHDQHTPRWLRRTQARRCTQPTPTEAAHPEQTLLQFVWRYSVAPHGPLVPRRVQAPRPRRRCGAGAQEPCGRRACHSLRSSC